MSGKTIFGAYLAIFGAIITISLNLILIPMLGFVGSAIATLACYFSMTILSFLLAKKHYPIDYDYKRILLYFSLMLSIFIILHFTSFTIIINSVFVFIYLIVIYLVEKPKKSINATPELF